VGPGKGNFRREGSLDQLTVNYFKILKSGLFGGLFSAFLSRELLWDFGIFNFELLWLFTLVHRRLSF
jgi:hypothetical protein